MSPIPFSFREAVPILLDHSIVVIGTVQIVVLKKDVGGNRDNPNDHPGKI